MSNHARNDNAEALETVPKTYDDAVQVLAAAHSVGDDLVEIYLVPDPQKQVVRLIEVSDAFPEGGVERPAPPHGMERVVPVFPMGPAKDFPFRSEVAQVTPAEWAKLQDKTLKLNRDWDLKQARKVPRA
jgi:hypothetical protein